MSALISWLLELFFPPKCMFCRRLLPDSARWCCDDCLAALPEWEGAAEKVPGFSGCAVAFSYEEPVRGAILRMKFQGLRAYIPQFARWMAVRVRAELAGQYDFVTWVPCSRRRRWQRGFDQAELLARALARELEAEVRPTLLKVRHNPPQSRTKSAAARRANVLGVYRILPGAPVSGAKILVVDDIITTGATLSACGQVLRLAGAADLVCAAIAATDHKDGAAQR